VQTADGPADRITTSTSYSLEDALVSLADFEHQLLSLPETDRIHLVEVLWESLLPDDVHERTKRWAVEAERRVDAVRAGELPLVDAGQALQELQARHRR
jgi:putative addiction module component (TIGR02574 family)